MRKTLSIIMAIFIVLTMILSVSFMAKNIHHKCSAHESTQSCPICAQLEVAREITTKIFAPIIPLIVSLIAICVYFVFFTYEDTICKYQTLITQKVRIDS